MFSQANRPWLAAALLIIGLGFAVRFINLGGDSFWLDEIFTVRVVTMTPPGLVPRELDHPPLLHILARYAYWLFGENQFAFRLPSALAGVLAIPLLIAAGKQWGMPQAGLWAGLLLALSPFHLRYSQEARQYALLMLCSLAAFFWLYRALYRPTWERWLAFSLATGLNLYSHYGALIFLAAQAVIIAIWSVRQLRGGRWRCVGYPVAAAFLVSLLYLPWLDRLQQDVARNVGAGSEASSFAMASAAEWAKAAFYAFGTTGGIIPYLMALAFFGGLGWLLYTRQLTRLGYLLAAFFLPFGFIILFEVNRAAWPRYIIYLLPLYLLPVGMTLAWGQQWAENQRGKTDGLFAVFLTLLILGGHWPMVRAEHRLVLEDWQGAAAQLAAMAQEGDVVITLSLNFPLGDNIVFDALPYHLQRSGRAYTVLHSNLLELETLRGLRPQQMQVWAVLTNWNQQTQLADPSFILTPYPLNIFVVHQESPRGRTLAQLSALYEQLIPLADAPVPRCLLERDLAAFYLADNQLIAAAAALHQSQTRCPVYPIHAGIEVRPVLAEQIYQTAYQTVLAAGQPDQADWLMTRWDEGWLTAEDVRSAMTAVDLLQLYEQGDGVLDDAAAPEPITIIPFNLPGQTSQPTLFMHPPAQMQYNLTLPVYPVWLQGQTAMYPDSWHWGGDGATFVITVQPPSGPAVELYRQHISNAPVDQKWHSYTISLAAYAGQTITLTLHTEAGPAADSTGDWAGWGLPRLVWGE